MGKPYKQRRKTLNLAAYKLRVAGWGNKEIAERLGVGAEQVPGMVLAGSRVIQTVETSVGGRNGSAVPALPSGKDET